ncbi:allophanate hydrolase [Campylobacter sp. MIT 99-7217]|uniref:5-oxoprolinase subunit C family protein n=1 Tax=Campylobacter sp. MIT 99-7217 TaxID=535091 RepID=UPI00115A3D72|nr:biotin-dependent carboxyltransferase family protein [Campylobacter sp. MIT 99-7217]TQR33796.1 allophanate hydrolase [Campylobacter sp. MIT 99-7217]
MSIKILKASLASSLQDLGRRGFANLGIARSGAMDAYSLRMANILLGNHQDEAGLEICLQGGVYEFLSDHYFVLSGADFAAKLDGKNIETSKVYHAKKGMILNLDIAKKGFRGYLCVAGGFKVKPFLQSKSSDIKMGVGLFEGRFLKEGDILPCEDIFVPFNLEKRSIENPILQLDTQIKVRVLLNESAFSKKGIQSFLNTLYTVGSKSDRMGIYCESDERIEHKDSADIISQPVVFGSIQVPASGLPIVLMAGRQSTGGYTMIASVIESDLYLLAQAKIGTKLRFERIDIQEALRLYKQREESLSCLDKSLNLDFENLV